MASLFGQDRSGVVAIIFALALTPLLIVIGSAVDYGRSKDAEIVYQNAADAAVLAASHEKLDDKDRIAKAEKVFEGMTSKIKPFLRSFKFTMDPTKTKIIADIVADVPNLFMGTFGTPVTTFQVKAASLIARPQIRQLDLVMCIDATGSMQKTIDAVKQNALNFEKTLNDELKAQGAEPFQAMRVRVIYFRDFGGAYTVEVNFSRWELERIYHPDSRYGRFGIGDNPPLRIGSFRNLPSERSAFQTEVQAENASGGLDEPESGLECVNEAMDSPWAKVGDTIAGNKTLEAIFPTVVVWTDANAHPPSYAPSLLNSKYPPVSRMPRSHAALRAKWDDPQRLDQKNKLLVFFGDPLDPHPATDVVEDGWPPVMEWPGYFKGGSLGDGTDLMMTKIAGAILSKVKNPVLTQ